MFTNFEFRYPGNSLYFILAVAALLFFIFGYLKKQRILTAILPGYTMRFRFLRPLLLGLGLTLLVVALLGPQVFLGYKQGGKTGLNIYVLMDTSKSMLVEDLKPDRLSVAKDIVEKLLDRLENDRIGFIPFASGAYIQMPLTDDYQLARMYLRAMDTDMIGGGGTNLAAAISLAYTSFNETDEADRVLLVLSDGEEYHAGAGLELLQSLVGYDERLKVFTIGLGTERGGPIPLYDDSGQQIAGYLKDENGSPAQSQLNAETLAQMAKIGGGVYYRASASAHERNTQISALMLDLTALQRDSLGSIRFKHFQALFQYFLGIGALLILLAWFLPERRMAE